MNIDIDKIIGQPESQTLEYKVVLPPSKNIAQLISSFANSEGGHIILGVSDDLGVVGLSSDFHANTIVNKAIELLEPKPSVSHSFIGYKNKNLYLIEVSKSASPIYLESKFFRRRDTFTRLENPVQVEFTQSGYKKITDVSVQLVGYGSRATSSKLKLLEHYQSILKIMDDLGTILYPDGFEQATSNQEGKVLTRILFSSLADNFETYLSDLLYEIFLAKPDSLKSQQQVSVKEVLDCADLEEFVQYLANKKIGKLQKGSVTGFIEDNQQIKSLKVVDSREQQEIEKILQIRHLYSHRNGVVDEKFIKYFPGEFEINSLHELAISDVLDKLSYLSLIVDSIDTSAINKYSLSVASTNTQAD
jgi:hypothetical protein